MRILGLSSFTHDTSAALLEDGEIRAAIEESKLVRSKGTRGLPEAAIQFCMRKGETSWQDIDYVAVSTRPAYGWVRRSMAGAKLSPLSPVAATYYQISEVGRLARELGNLRVLRHANRKSPARVLQFEHHLCHAASAFFPSPFEHALILTIDEEGDGKSASLAVGEGNRIRVIRTLPYPHSLAWLYSQITNLLGFVPRLGEHKTQWLSLNGEPAYLDVFRDMVRTRAGALPKLDSSYIDHDLGGHFTLSSKFYRRIGVAESKPEFNEEQKQALAATVQLICTEVVTEILDASRKELGIDQVCLAGGLFQNTLLVHSIERHLGLNQVFVPPAPGNAGSSVGAALLAHHQVSRAPRKPVSSLVYLGPSYSRHEIKNTLDNCKAKSALQTTDERRCEAAAQLLQAGKIIGWFQGAAEFGPRALGNRSVLASPWAPYVKENLNDFIKQRENFRPFAVSVPEEDAGRYFEYSQLCRSMSSLALVRQDAAGVLEGFVLPGNRIRLHVVEKASNPVLWGLLKHFGKNAPAPILLNTSFNLFGEPLVLSPLDAIRSYSCSGVDALMINNFLLSKAPLPFAARIAEYSVRSVQGIGQA